MGLANHWRPSRAWVLYDEVVPSAKELLEMDRHAKPFLLESCLYLFSPFHRLAEGEFQEVSTHDWVGFWFTGSSRYVEPPQKASKVRTTKPRKNHNPSGRIDKTFLPRTSEENAPFIELGEEESLINETNLAAFLGCWLYKFVLPNKKVDHVRASVSKVASLMAHGVKFSLAVPTLSKSKAMKDVDAPARKKVRRLSLASKTTTIAPKVSNYSCKRKEHLVLSNEDNNREPSLLPLCDDKNYLPVLPNGIGDFTTSSNPVESESSEDHHWNRPNNKAKKLGDNYCGTAALDTIIIKDDAFVDEDTSLTMSFPELPEHSNLQELCNDELGDNIIEDHFADIDDLGMTAKSFHKSPNGSKDHVMSETKSNDLLQAAQTLSKSKAVKDVDAPAKKKVRQLSLASKTTTTALKPDHHELFNDELGDDIIEDFLEDIDDLGMTAKSFHKSPNGSKDQVMGGASSVELIPPRNQYSSSPVHRKFIQLAVTSEDVAATTEVMHLKSFRPSSWPL
ncbi:hypothetical protein A4A49_03953 [Nicotiana attenuata]|uniref:Aminotransferase-like plant mobile domain-containing protein n=1 Tax=Nicotiana attenuata TaxID=49451 RepID=A0A314L2H7_NICAT|nr:hypothetical protein A4A49_03953 [Nicotiana attenuata]